MPQDIYPDALYNFNYCGIPRIENIFLSGTIALYNVIHITVIINEGMNE